MPRVDALRSRDAILRAARAVPPDELRLNDIAREAGVGVATVYRHFPTVNALVEALALDSVEQLRALACRAQQEPDPDAALHRFLTTALERRLVHEGVQRVLTTPDGELDAAREAKCAFVSSLAVVLARAQREGAVRPDVGVDQLQRMLCGIEHAVRLGDPDDRPVLIDVFLAGLRAPRPSLPSPTS
jgi:AcrR family transcriptional regulator